jgi:transcription initiation factor TFIIF subunit alpha
MGGLFDEDEDPDSRRRRQREFGGDGDLDEQVYEEDFADDEERAEDDHDEEAKELEVDALRIFRRPAR